MGGTPCKIIIDNSHGLTRVMACMSTSVLLASAANGGSVTIPPDLVSQFLAQSEALAKTAAAIEAAAGYGR